MKHTIKTSKKTMALLLAVLMTLSVFSVVGFAEGTQYTVRFYNQPEHSSFDEEGNVQPAAVIYSFPVNAGGSVADPFAGKTTEEIEALGVLAFPQTASGFTKLAFKCWDKPLTNIQSDLNVYPEFQTVGKRYKIMYHNFDGSAIQGLNDEFCIYNDDPQESSTPSYPVIEGDNNNKIEHLTYNFVFKCWSLKPGVDPTKTPEDSKYLLNWRDGLQLPTDDELGQSDPKQPGYINVTKENSEGYIPLNVYAYYTRHTIEYTMSLTVNDSYGQPVNHAAVQIKDSTGQLLRQTFEATDEEGNHTGQYASAAGYTNSKGEISFKVPFQTIYTIQASDENLGAIIKELPYTDSAHFNLSQRTIACTVSLNPTSNSYNEQYKPRCTCVCHSFIGGLWITALNLMYSFFKVKYVCCYDMYATHADRLAYAA